MRWVGSRLGKTRHLGPESPVLPRKACQGSSAPEAPVLIAEPHGNLMHKPEAGVAPAAPESRTDAGAGKKENRS